MPTHLENETTVLGEEKSLAGWENLGLDLIPQPTGRPTVFLEVFPR